MEESSFLKQNRLVRTRVKIIEAVKIYLFLIYYNAKG
jgi:hypothetical protein